jgi:hypothetical protein
MKKVLIGTPSYDGKLEAWYVNSLINTIRLGVELDIEIIPIFLSYDSLVQRARNDLFRIAIENNYDTLFFIDSDVEWNVEWFFNILERSEPIVGGALIKKSEKESYTVKITNKELNYSEDGKIIEVDGVGTGFLKIDRFALEKLWSDSEEYIHEGIRQRMVFNITIDENKDLVSEDYVLCQKWKKLGYKVWIDPKITCNHIGVKKYEGNLMEFLKKLDYV